MFTLKIKGSRFLLASGALALALGFSSTVLAQEHGNRERGEHRSERAEERRDSRDEHAEGRGEARGLITAEAHAPRHPEGGGEGEESGTRYTPEQTYDVERNGIHLVLAFDAEQEAFVGTAKNVTDETVEKVRIEVHTSAGVELGPTPRVDMEPGETLDVVLSTEGFEIEWWNAHAETGNEEHGEGSEGHAERERGEHGNSERGEHGQRERGERHE